MKKILLLSIHTFICFVTFAQVSPQWTRSITGAPDSSFCYPVRVLSDGNDNAIVLSYLLSLPGHDSSKVLINKFDSMGQLLWTTSYDHNGTGSPRGFDMVIDASGNCYVAGGFMNTNKILLMKISASGNIVWVRDSASAQITDPLTKLILRNGRLYMSGNGGIAVFDVLGSEIWSLSQQVNFMTLDNNAQIIFSGYSTQDNLFRCDSAGNLNFSDSTIETKRICTDSHNNFFLLSDFPYEVVKYDSSGSFLWHYTSFGPQAPFGDINFDIITDMSDNLFVVAINDSIFKFSPSGNLMWTRTMGGLDTYMLDVKMYWNTLMVAGATYNLQQYDCAVSLFNSYGIQNWSGAYNSNVNQEFGVDAVMGNSEIYAIEDSMSNTVLMKFQIISAGNTPVNYSLVCVDSVWYDPSNPQLINVSVFNGDIVHMNYPSVMIVSPNGDTISNVHNTVNFFAQLSNGSQVYTDTILVQGITDFHGYTFIISEGFGDTTGIIDFCSTLSVMDIQNDQLVIYPNPVTDRLHFVTNDDKIITADILDVAGRKIMSNISIRGNTQVDVSFLKPGFYLVRTRNAVIRFIKAG